MKIFKACRELLNLKFCLEIYMHKKASTVKTIFEVLYAKMSITTIRIREKVMCCHRLKQQIFRAIHLFHKVRMNEEE